ncbi:MAG: DUF6265 family protein [Pseudomonadota bacterium]
MKTLLAAIGLCYILIMPNLSWADQVRLSDLDWMTGSWAGPVGNPDNPQRLEETWGDPLAGTMTAMVRMTMGDRTVMIELISITESEDSLLLHIQQFNPDMSPRFEPAQRLRLVSLEGQKLSFKADSPGGIDSLVYHRQADHLTITVALAQGAQFIAPLQAVNLGQ